MNPALEGNTPLDADERAGLIPLGIRCLADLNTQEQENIAAAQVWLLSRRRWRILDIQFLLRLHKKMFGRTWRWAGQFRGSNKNIGVDKSVVSFEVKKLCDDLAYWQHENTYDADEAAVRFHHRLVFIHPFVNGNGRFARLITDDLLRQAARPQFSWGAHDLHGATEARRKYLNALRAADAGDYTLLFRFVRS